MSVGLTFLLTALPLFRYLTPRPALVSLLEEEELNGVADAAGKTTEPLRIYDREGVWVATVHAGVDLNRESVLHDIRPSARAGADDTR